VKSRFIILLLLAISYLNTIPLQAQHLVWKSSYKNGISEKYLVLKKDKSIKHGQYLLVYNDYWFKKYIMEVGQYENNQKAGTWIYFYFKDPSNFIKSVGDYKNGKKEGVWTYYHKDNHTTMDTMLGSSKRTRIHEPKGGTLEYKIEVDTAGHQLESTGVYLNDQKIGVWEYFSASGALVNSYDHTAGKLLVNNLEHLENSSMTYLGGISRFLNYFYTAQQENPLKKPVTQATEMVFEMKKNGDYNYVSGSGDALFKEHIAAILQTIPKEWIYLDGEAKEKLQFIVKAENAKGYTIHLKAVE
jgi:antitoxin component YwqK of YwqJK toxin-antitoxin module